MLVNGPSVEEAEEAENEADTIILVNKNNDNTPKQSGSKILGFFSVIILTIAFVSLLVYTTQPNKKVKYYGTKFGELTDYLLIKEKGNKECEIRDF